MTTGQEISGTKPTPINIKNRNTTTALDNCLVPKSIDCKHLPNFQTEPDRFVYLPRNHCVSSPPLDPAKRGTESKSLLRNMKKVAEDARKITRRKKEKATALAQNVREQKIHVGGEKQGGKEDKELPADHRHFPKQITGQEQNKYQNYLSACTAVLIAQQSYNQAAAGHIPPSAPISDVPESWCWANFSEKNSTSLLPFRDQLPIKLVMGPNSSVHGETLIRVLVPKKY